MAELWSPPPYIRNPPGSIQSHPGLTLLRRRKPCGKARVFAIKRTLVPNSNQQHSEHKDGCTQKNYHQRWKADGQSGERSDGSGHGGHNHRQHARQRLKHMNRRPKPSSRSHVDAKRLERAGYVVEWAGREIWLQLGIQLEVSVAQPVHPDDPAEVVSIELHQAGDRRQAGEEDNQKSEDGDQDESWSESIRLSHEREGDHRTRQDGEKNVHPTE